MKIKKRVGDRTPPCGTPDAVCNSYMCIKRNKIVVFLDLQIWYKGVNRADISDSGPQLQLVLQHRD